MPSRRTKPVPKVSINEPSPVFGRIAWHIENTLVRFIKRIFNEIGDNVRSMFSYALEEFTDLFEDGLIEIASPILDEVERIEGIPNWIKVPIRRARQRQHVAAVAIIIPIVLAVLMGAVMAVVGPITRRIQYEVEQFVETYRPPPETLIAMLRRGGIDPAIVDNYLDELGVSEPLEAGYKELTLQRLPVAELGNSYLRGLIGRSELETELTRRGLASQDIGLFFELLQIIPGPSDLVRMAVREAWNDGVAREFGYDDDFPVEFAQWAEKIGLSQDWSIRFWRAHWELPGVREGFEMLHRRIIDRSQLELLMKARDIPSFWRNSLIQLSYRPYTRVDVRRMYTAGVLSEDEVFASYLDIGYDEEHATKMTQWTVEEFGETSRDLTKADVLGAYLESVINQEEATNLLSAIDYSEGEIAILLARADIKRQERFEAEFVENVRVSYVGKAIERNDVISRLGQLNPPSGFIQERLDIWDLQRERQVRRPTTANVKKFLLMNIISEGEARDELKKRDYEDYVIDWYISSWFQEIQ